MTASIIDATCNASVLGSSTTWVSNLYSRYTFTYRATNSGTLTLRFTDTSANDVDGSDCLLDRVELRDVTPPPLFIQSPTDQPGGGSGYGCLVYLSGGGRLGGITLTNGDRTESISLARLAPLFT